LGIFDLAQPSQEPPIDQAKQRLARLHAGDRPTDRISIRRFGEQRHVIVSYAMRGRYPIGW
jgi:hypothetical protein